MTMPAGNRKKPVAVETNVTSMLSERAFGSAIPDLLNVLKERIIPQTVPRMPTMGASVSKAPMTMPAIANLRFVFMGLPAASD